MLAPRLSHWRSPYLNDLQNNTCNEGFAPTKHTTKQLRTNKGLQHSTTLLFLIFHSTYIYFSFNKCWQYFPLSRPVGLLGAFWVMRNQPSVKTSEGVKPRKQMKATAPSTDNTTSYHYSSAGLGINKPKVTLDEKATLERYQQAKSHFG